MFGEIIASFIQEMIDSRSRKMRELDMENILCFSLLETEILSLFCQLKCIIVAL